MKDLARGKATCRDGALGIEPSDYLCLLTAVVEASRAAGKRIGFPVEVHAALARLDRATLGGRRCMWDSSQPEHFGPGSCSSCAARRTCEEA